MNITSASKIFVAGHNGLVGRAIVKSLRSRGYQNVVTRTRQELDLLDSAAVLSFLQAESFDLVIIAAAKVGGILANNTYRGDFIFQNLQIQNSLIWGAHQTNVPNLIFLGSSCIYPKEALQPIVETSLLTGPLEETNKPYAIAKIAGLELVNSIRRQFGRNYFSVMPTNLFGPGDNFDPLTSHVMPALIRRFLEAAETNAPSVVLWGSGKPRREFLFSEDCADAITFLMENLPTDYFEKNTRELDGLSHINVGSGEDIAIAELAKILAEAVGYKGEIVNDLSKPDGTFRKLMSSQRLLNLGWRPRNSLMQGISKTIDWYKSSL